jgi:hypothetical protein
MKTMVEAELQDYAKNKAVTRLTITSGDSGYRIMVNLTWKEGDWHLTTSLKKIRTWASLDRLVLYLKKVFSVLPPVSLSFQNETGILQ